MTATLVLPYTTDVGSRYQISSEAIARGGYATVSRGHDGISGAEVAIKRLHRAHRDDPTMPMRLHLEALVMANLDHPNIVRFIAIDRSHTAIVIEFVDGGTLDRLVGHQLRPQRIADIALQLCEALGALHKLGLVHRDVKPGNIMITDTGIVKLIDFSIAKEVGMVQHLPDLDITGSICGTASYFSPEQAYGYGVSFPSDVFSLGLVLFELISGRSPYSFGATPTAYHTASVTPESGSMVLGPAHEIEPIKRANCIIQETPARLRELMPNADPRLSDLLATMLSFKPEDRPSLAEISAFFAGLASP